MTLSSHRAFLLERITYHDATSIFYDNSISIVKALRPTKIVRWNLRILYEFRGCGHGYHVRSIDDVQKIAL
jgi:hypothetical protein